LIEAKAVPVCGGEKYVINQYFMDDEKSGIDLTYRQILPVERKNCLFPADFIPPGFRFKA